MRLRRQVKKSDTYSLRSLWPASVFLISFLIYVSSLPVTVSIEDSAEFVTTAATLGIPHPSGYPLHVLLGKLFTYVPFGTIPWRVALLSACSASLALMIGFLIVRRIYEALSTRSTNTIQFTMAVVLIHVGVTETWWSQAIMAEVYALHVALFAAVTYFLLRWIQDRKNVFFTYASLLMGLMLANHLYLSLSVLPFFAVIVFLMLRNSKVSRKDMLLSALALCAGLLPYVALVIQSMMRPRFAMGNVSTWRGFLNHVVFRTRYQDLGLDGINKIGLILDYFIQIFMDFGAVVVVLAGIGLYRLMTARARGNRMLGVWLGGAFLSVPMIHMIRAYGWNEGMSYLSRVYGLHGMFVVGLFAAIGIGLLVKRSRRIRWGYGAAVVLLSVLMATVVFTWTESRSAMRVFSDSYVEDYFRAYLESLPEDSVLVLNDFGFIKDTEIFALAYLQVVQHLREDVTIVTDAQMHPFSTPEQLSDGYISFSLDLRRRLLLEAVLRESEYEDRPIFTSFQVASLKDGWKGRATGFAYRIDWVGPTGTEDDYRHHVPLPPDDLPSQLAMNSFASHSLYNYATLVLERDGIQSATPFLLRAMELDPIPQSSDYRGFVNNRAMLMDSDELIHTEDVQ